MTSGYINSSNPSSLVNHAIGSLPGVLETKTWSGGDKVSLRPKKPAPVPPQAPRASDGTLSSDRIRWGSVVRHDGSVPSRGMSEQHGYTMVYRKVQQEEDTFVIPDYQKSDGTWAVLSGIVTPLAWTGIPFPTYSWSSNDDLELLNRLRTKIAGSDFNAGVALAEGGEALRMITGSATRLYNAYRHFRRGNLYDASRALGVSPRASSGRVKSFGTKNGFARESSSRWLELQYGWLPLVQDVYGGAQFLAHHLNVPLQRSYRVRYSVKGAVNSPSEINYEVATGQAVTRGQIVAIVREKDVAQLAGLQDPASILWEVTPYSFVADWFIPIGSWLSARGLRGALQGTFVTTKTEIFTASGFKERPTSYPYRVPKAYGMREISVHRTVSSELQVPMPSFQPLSKAVSWKRAANAVALLVSSSATRR